MKATSGLVMIVFLGLVSCFNPPEYPNTPEIEYSGATFVDVPAGTVDSKGFTIPDSLLVSIKFKDGDGDIGLLNDVDYDNREFGETFYFRTTDSYKYVLNSLYQDLNPQFGIVVARGSFTDVATDKTFIKYSTKRTNPKYDTLPSFTKLSDCLNWEIAYKTVNNITSVIDTVYFQINPNHYNIFVDFLKLKNDGSGDFEEYDFRKEFCTTYDGRIPIIAKELGSNTPLQGTINYWMKGLLFKDVFSNTPIKLRIQILDRALHKSNIIVSEPFTLSSITK